MVKRRKKHKKSNHTALDSKAKRIQNAFLNPNAPGSFSGFSTLHRNLSASKHRGHRQLQPSPAAVQDALRSIPAYSRHAPRKHRFQRSRVVVFQLNECWELDLADLSGIASENDNFKWLFCAIDVLSKYAFVVAMRSKTGKEVARAFEGILERSDNERLPATVRSDRGKEYVNKNFQQVLNKYEIEFVPSVSDMKCTIVERFIQTFKTKMWRYFTAQGNYRYIDVLPSLLHSYNTTKQSRLGISPSEINASNFRNVWERLYGAPWPGLTETVRAMDSTKTRQLLRRFPIGCTVRLAKYSYEFDKGYYPRWTSEVFTVERIVKRNPPMAIIQDESGKTIDGAFHFDQIQRI